MHNFVKMYSMSTTYSTAAEAPIIVLMWNHIQVFLVKNFKFN